MSGSLEIEVIVVGAAAMDIVVQVERLPQPDDLVLAKRVDYLPGGSAANVAVGIARLGYSTGFIGKLGDDLAGQRLLDAFKQEGVDTSRCVIAPGRPSSSCIVTVCVPNSSDPRVNGQGERTIIALGGAGFIENVSELDINDINKALVVYISDICDEVAAAAMQAAKGGGALAIYSPGTVIANQGYQKILHLFEKIDLLLLSKTELNHLLPNLDEEPATNRLAEMGVKNIIVTLGSKGALICEDGNLTRVSAYPIEDIVDTTGAGDAFAAGVIVGYLKGYGWIKAAKVGCAAAGIKLKSFGAREGLPSWKEVNNFLRQHPET